MAENTKIEWCDHTVNLWWGCAKVHTGCKNCYAQYFSDTRYKNNLWGSDYRKMIKSAFSDLDKYEKQAKASGTKLRIFVGSMMDIFEEENPLLNPRFEGDSTYFLRSELFNQIREGKYNNLVFLLLTKRPHFIHGMIGLSWALSEMVPNNVWFGCSISDQATADFYLNQYYKTNVIGNSNQFISLEPQVGAVDLSEIFATGHINWLIQGGESGHKKRPFDIQWAREMRQQCKEANVPYFFKQIDKIQPIPDDLLIREFPEF